MAVSKQQLIDDVRELADDMAETPTLNDYRAKGSHSTTPMYREFDSWNELLEAAGLESNAGSKLTKDDLVAEFKRLADELGEPPTKDEFVEHGKYSETPIYNRFDSYNDLKEAAGFDGNEYRISNDELIEDVQRVAEKVERTPRVLDYKEHGNHGFTTQQRRFGAWKDVLQEAGFKPTEHSMKYRQEFDFDEYERGNLVGVECEYCGETVQKRPHQIKRFDSIYCSEECRAMAFSELEDNDHPNWGGGKVTHECDYCGDEYSVTPATAKLQKFCSKECAYQYREENDLMKGENSPRWRGGHERYYGHNWEEQREKAIQRDNEQCQICQRTRQQHYDRWGKDIEVHHFKRVKEFDDKTDAHHLSNLVTLCKRCHQWAEAGRITAPKPSG